MDLFKALTGKNPAEFEQAAKILVNTPDIELFKKLVKQDDFLFDFVKNNVAKRIQSACNKDNYINLLEFCNYYSPSYDTVIAEVLHQYGGVELYDSMKEMIFSDNQNRQAYATKFLTFADNAHLSDVITKIRENAHSDFEPLAINSIELLAKLDDNVSKEEAIKKLSSEDEFEQFDAIKFLVTFGAKDCINKILEIMKKSTLAENIASEIPFLVPIEELLKNSFDDGILVLCNIVNAIPEILPPTAVLDYGLYEIFDNLYRENLTSSSALLLRMAKDKFEALCENEEYLFDSDKNTKDEVFEIKKLLDKMNTNKLNSLLYDELFEESDFVFYAVDFVNEIEELETLLDSKNQTLILKVLTTLKEKQALTQEHKNIASSNITSDNIKQIVEVL